MKRLVLRKEIDLLIKILFAIFLIGLCTIEINSILLDLAFKAICLIIIVPTGILIGLYGRD